MLKPFLCAMLQRMTFSQHQTLFTVPEQNQHGMHYIRTAWPTTSAFQQRGLPLTRYLHVSTMRPHLYAHHVADIAFSKRQAPSRHWPGQVAIVPIVPERHNRSATEFTSNIFSTTMHLSHHSSPCAPCSSRRDDVFYK